MTAITEETAQATASSKPKAGKKGKSGARSAHVAPGRGKAGKKATGGNKARRGGHKPTAAREGSKKAEVLDLLRRKQGATLAEIMKATGWQPHTVRGFVSGTLSKKLGLKVESFRSQDKERTYRIPA